MQIIETTAPISLEHLKAYFQDKNTFYRIDYTNSELKDDKLFVYLSNLELPCDLVFSTEEEVMHAIKSYLHFTHILSIPILEHMVISIIKQWKGLIEKIWPDEFLEDNKEILTSWIKKLDSLTLYNLYIIDSEEFKDHVKEYKENDTNSIEGINFVSLLKHESFYDCYAVIDGDNLEYYSNYFNEYIFKGNNLYKYWANENNPMFMLTWAIASGEMNLEEYVSSVKEDEQELVPNVSPS